MGTENENICVGTLSAVKETTIRLSLNFRVYSLKNLCPYIGISSIPDPSNILPSLFSFSDLAKSFDLNDPLCPQKSSDKELVSDKWVYIFKKKGNYITIHAEMFIQSSNEEQNIYYVNWSGTAAEVSERWKNTYPRKYASKANNSCRLTISEGTEYYIFLSQESLPVKRIQSYLDKPELFVQRAFLIDFKTAVTMSDPVSICLVDFIRISTELFNLYNEELKKRNAINTEKEKTFSAPNAVARFNYSKMVKELADKHKEVKEKINYKQLEVYLEKVGHEQKLNHINHDIEYYSKLVTNWISSYGYKITRDDYRIEPELFKVIFSHEAIFNEQLRRSKNGNKFYDTQAHDRLSWYYAVTDDPETDFDKVFAANRRLFQGADKFYEFLINRIEMEINACIKNEMRFLDESKKAKGESDELFKKRSEILNKIKDLKNNKGARKGKPITKTERAFLLKDKVQKLLKRFEIPDCSPDAVKFISEKSSQLIYDPGLAPKSNKDIMHLKDTLESIQGKVIDDAIKAKNVEAQKFQADADAAKMKANILEGEKAVLSEWKVNPKRILIIIDQVNALLAFKDLADQLKHGDTEDKSFALLNTAGAIIDATVHFEKLVRTVFKKSIASQSSQLVKVGRYAAFNLAQEAADKIVFRYLELFSGAIDTIVAAHNIYKYIRKGEYRQIWGEAIAGIGYIMSTITAGVAIYGIATASLESMVLLGIGTGGWGFIAMGVIIAGNIIAYVLRPRPLRDWADESLWSFGNAVKFEGEGLTESEVNLSIRKLLDKFATYSVYPYVKMQYHHEPTLPARFDNTYFTVQGIAVRIIPGIFHDGKSRIHLNIDFFHDRPYPLNNLTILKGTVTIDSSNATIHYKGNNKDNVIEYVEKMWSIDELDSVAKKNGYSCTELTNVFEEWRSRKYFMDQAKRISVENRYSFYAKCKSRLDLNGNVTPQVALAENLDNKLMVFPTDEFNISNDSCWAQDIFSEKTTFDKIQRALIR